MLIFYLLKKFFEKNMVYSLFMSRSSLLAHFSSQLFIVSYYFFRLFFSFFNCVMFFLVYVNFTLIFFWWIKMMTLMMFGLYIKGGAEGLRRNSNACRFFVFQLFCLKFLAYEARSVFFTGQKKISKISFGLVARQRQVQPGRPVYCPTDFFSEHKSSCMSFWPA